MSARAARRVRSMARCPTRCSSAAASRSGCSVSRPRMLRRRRPAARRSTFADPGAEGTAAAAALRRRGANLVVAVTHQHMAADRALAAAAAVDVILGGHEHEPLVAEVGKAVITKAGSDARYLVEVDVWMRPGGALVERSWTFHEVSARLPEDPDVAALVREYETRLGRELAVEIGRTSVPLDARRAPLRTSETNVGDFVADAMRARLEADVAVVNGGG